MNGEYARKVTVKVTFVDEEQPDLYAAVCAVRGLRRRSTRIRDLMVKGLLQEGGEAVTPGRPTQGRVRPDGETVDAMLDWER